MNMTIVNNILTTINENDKLFLLGDIWDPKYLKFFNYFKMYFILGNHDKQKSKYNKIINVINEYNLDNIILYKHPVKIKDILILSHEPYQGKGPFINIHGHLHNKFMQNDIKNEKYYFNCCVENIEYKPIIVDEIFNRIPFKYESVAQ